MRNSEELYAQKEFEIRERERKDFEIAELVVQLNFTRNTNDYLNDELDRRIEQIDLIRGACQKYCTDPEFSKGLFLDSVMQTVDWKR